MNRKNNPDPTTFVEKSKDPKSTIRNIRIDKIDPNPNQPRKRFTDIDPLAASVKAVGVLEPITVRPKGDRFEIISGERRWRAAKLAGLLEIPALIREATDDEALELGLIENLQRLDLTAIEEAEAFKILIDRKWTQARIAELVGKDASYVSHKLRLLKLPEILNYFLRERLVSENHMRQVLTLEAIYSSELVSTFYQEELEIIQFPEDSISKKKGKTFVNPQKSISIPYSKMTGEEKAFALLARIRPEEFALPCATVWPEPVVNACSLYLEHVSKQPVPQWQAAAFWWLAFTVRYKVTVTDLSRALIAWKERYHSALIHILILNEDWEKYLGSGRSKEWDEVWWAYWAHLRHSSSLHRKLDPLEKIKLLTEVLGTEEGGRPFALPLSTQVKIRESLLALSENVEDVYVSPSTAEGEPTVPEEPSPVPRSTGTSAFDRVNAEAGKEVRP